MSGSITKRLLRAYYQEPAAPTSYFMGMFQAPAENYYASEEVELDIVRSDEDVSIVIQDIAAGYRMNSEDLYTNKRFKPPVHKEAIPLNSHDLLKRMPGNTPFQNPEFQAAIVQRMFSGMRKVERKIRRAMELQASQVLQTGAITLTDSNGTALYTLNFQPKSSHFPTAGTSWATATLAEKLGDLTALCDVIRSDSLYNPDEVTFGVDAWENLIGTEGFLDSRLDSRRASLGGITPMERRGDGGIYRGALELGNYRVDVFTYDGRYKDPQTGTSTQFMDPAKVVVRASAARLDATFGAIPNIGRELGATNQVLPQLPGRMSSMSGRMDLFTNVWTTPDGEQLIGGVGSRPLMIPTAIDSFGCLDTQL